MKKKLPILLTLILTLVLCVIGLTACGGVKFKVNFIVDGEVYATIDTSGNEIIAMPEDPIKEGFEFDGWFWDKDTWQQPFTANSLLNAPLSSDMKVYAKWEAKNAAIDGFSFKTLTFDGTSVYGKVANNVEFFSFLTEITTSTEVKYNISVDITGNDKIDSKTLPLNEGDNIVYITKLVNNEVVAIYKATIRRRPMCVVSFNCNGGTSVQSQTIEEDAFATPPTTTRTGYTFVGWDYDFSAPITSNKTITASWSPNTNTPYKVEYYLENATDNGYTKHEGSTETLYGTTDSQVSAQVKTFSHFEYKDTAEDSGTISPNGSTVLKVYYTRQKVQVTFNANGGALSSGNNTQMVKYGGTAVAPSFTKTGYSFNGFDKSLENITTETIISATWQINQYTLTIVFDNGQKDKVITQDYNSQINYQLPTELEKAGYAFDGFNGAVPSVMPAENQTISAKWIAIFSKSGGEITGLTTYGITLNEIVIPATIEGISITSIGYSAFYNCDSLTSIEIPNSVTSIGEDAFRYCDSLTSIEIPNSVTSIGKRAFAYCSSLTSVTIGENVQSIGYDAFTGCTALKNIYFNDTSTWYRTTSESDLQNKTGGTETSVTNSSKNATNFTSTYDYYYWYKI